MCPYQNWLALIVFMTCVIDDGLCLGVILDLLSDDSLVVPDSVPDAENFSLQLIVHLGIKSQNNAQAETVVNNTR